MSRRLIAKLSTIVLVAALLSSGASAAQADLIETSRASGSVKQQGIAPAFGTITQRKTVNQTSTKNYVDRSKEISRCNIATTGLSCSINKTSQATRTIDLALGMSRGSVAANLGISDSTSVSVSVTCNSGALKKGQSLVAYSVGTRYKYKISKIVARSGVILSNETSGWLYAFDPSSAGISCKVL